MEAWKWRRQCWIGILCLAASALAFSPPPRAPKFFAKPPIATTTATTPATRLISLSMTRKSSESLQELQPVWKRVCKRLNTLEAAGLTSNDNEDTSSSPILMRGPGLKRALILFGVAFLWKWYRARFINKIPVWDRQPQWNMVITSREQEKDLKAYTCKNCGSTLFIAKNREWFFSGDTGLGGLGCYTCGAKGKDNFVMDRDRILEDVGEDDDYFDYERPLDFVSAAERRAVMKKAKGDEDLANQMLIDAQTKAEGGDVPQVSEEEISDAEIEVSSTEEGTETEQEELIKEEESPAEDEAQSTSTDETTAAAESAEVAPAETKEPEPVELETEAKPKKKSKKKKKITVPEEAPVAEKKQPPKNLDSSFDDLDVLGMDDF